MYVIKYVLNVIIYPVNYQLVMEIPLVFMLESKYVSNISIIS